jgi:tetratricopeptide (TPR) repeat protein
MLMVGYCLRMLSQFDDARDAYNVLRGTAANLGSEQYLLLSELGFAKIAIERGNLPAAAGMLDQLIEETREQEHRAIRAKALLDRARVANQLGDFATAATLGHEALTFTNDPVDRDRALGNLAMTFTHMGLWDHARDANLVLSATAQEATVRWIATLNLMELAYLEQREPMFERYRRSLANVELPPYVQAVYFETLAHGCRTFGRETEATRAFEQMRDVGMRFGLNEFTVRAEIALEDVMRAIGPVDSSRRCRVSEQPREVAEVAHAITEMREMVDVQE